MRKIGKFFIFLPFSYLMTFDSKVFIKVSLKICFQIIRFHTYFYQKMSESDDIIAEDGTLRQEPPSETTPSIDPQSSLNKTLLEINTNMGNVAALLQQLSSGPLPIGHRPGDD